MFNRFLQTLCIIVFAQLIQEDKAESSSVEIAPGSYCLAPQMRSPEIFRIDGIPISSNSVAYRSFLITVTCRKGFRLVGKKVGRCVDGEYIEEHGRCYVINEDEDKALVSVASQLCEVPAHPRHGSYDFSGQAHPDLPYAYYQLTLEFRCNLGYQIQGSSFVTCNNGSWPGDMPVCVSKYGYLADPLDTGMVSRNCKAPEPPKHGSYTIEGDRHPDIASVYTKMYIFVNCDDGFQIHGEEFVRCQNGKWSAEMPLCGFPCQLRKDPRVDYLCESRNMATCEDYVNPGEIVTPVCKDNVTRDDITMMRCGENGYFDHIETCAPENRDTECGLVTVSDGLIIGGSRVEHGEVPWHAGVYTKTTKPFMQICGGTIVSATSVISAAHCFWSDNTQVKPATEYAVAVGKIYRPWNDPLDIHAQKCDVIAIKIPILYFGSTANYQNDIAVLKLATSIEFSRFIRPICLDFTEDLDSSQLEGFGKVAGWGLKSEEGNPSQTLKAVFLPVVALDKCVNESPVAFKPYITADKICAGYTNGTAVCKGDSGGGLVFHRIQNSVYKYYLHGIVSTAPNYGLQQCNAFTWATFTSIIKHKGFIYSNIK